MEKNWKTNGDIILLHMCTINHRMYGSWDIKCPLTSSQPKQSKFWNNDNKKNTWRYYHLHLCNTNDDHDVWFLRYEARQTGFFVILGYFLPFYPPNNPENQSFEKWKKVLKISFYTRVAKNMTRWCTVPEIWCMTDRQTDGRTDGRMEKVTYRC